LAPNHERVGNLPGSVLDTNLAATPSASQDACFSDCLLLGGSVDGGPTMALLQNLPTIIFLAGLYVLLVSHLLFILL
jgi:hypothetical protein